ncbi:MULTISPECIES: thiamine pyrophosphate-binding protein [Mycobacterium]|uniref:acetolactate synthase n=2 Tax=Mycobacterium TaxID=1763 RepID=A0A1X1V9W3_MYCGS|nr:MULTISPECIES: thiamine pyrophosphate-binding protein [Mycobacterium]KZS65376.1 acetolactate synthase [Mycobacterium ostraviense]ORV65819.1 acetolactate synthase [Mycobacterium gastri]UGT93990.1 thiamine pyrophosphate-binding protein [Mycobacterium ostraviense]
MSQTMRLADYLFARLRDEGVDAVFLVPGGGAMYLVDALGQNRELRYVPTHHEQAAAIAAEAYSRINGHLGCALVTTGPGATNAITGVAGAWIESVPLLVISGQVKRADLMGNSGVRQKGPQEVDIVSMVKPITKYAVTVPDPSEIRYHFEKAVHLATTGRRGPVWLDIPLDVQAAQINPSALKGYVPSTTGSKNLTADATAVLDLVNAAERPIILAGHGIRLAEAAEDFGTLYETLGIPVVTTWNATDLIPSNHRLSVGKPGTVALRPPNFAIQNSDLVLSIGARLDNVVTAYNPAKFGRHAPKVIVDVDPAELGKFPDDMNIARTVCADARDFIRAMLEQKPRMIAKDRSSWLDHCNDWKARYPINDGAPFPKSGVISHYHLTKVLADEIPENTLIVTGSSGLAIEIFHTGFANKPGQRIFLTSGLGAMGYGLPAMVGAGLASDAKSFVGIEGDGSLMMNVQELQTIRMLDLPLKLFLFNNGGYASIRNTQRNYFEGHYVGTGPEGRLGLPDFVALAKANGIESMRIQDVGELALVVREALSQRGPLIVDVQVQHDEALWPKSAALPQPDGSIRSMPLEDMSPLLPRAEFGANMLVPLDPASKNLPERLIEQSKNGAKP